jgi:dipeptidyl aminopeptidase/acylaminoacyl peptidase
MLFKPEDFDPARSYPMIVYFYERDSDRLHRHRPPQAHRSVIIPTFYTSNDYVVFVPDVWYREGYPGDSAMESIMPKVVQAGGRAWIDAARVGIQGHSWAGYQIAYMVTQTDFFRAAAGGAPVANMTSAYGGIRWQHGHEPDVPVRAHPEPPGQDPVGSARAVPAQLAAVHGRPDQYAVADDAQRPGRCSALGAGDRAVRGLRRLGKPAWLINYNDEPHWPTTFANRRDWQIRLQQYFDHYLKDEPAPRWLREGIPALEKGATLGY